MTTDSMLVSRGLEAARYVPVLECLVNDGTIVLATDVVGQIVEYDVSPLPLAHDHVSGLAVVEGRLLMSLAPSRLETSGGPRRTKGVILRLGAEHAGMTFALEVKEVLSLLEAAVSSSAASKSSAWLGRATTRDGREVSWLDARELVRALTENASFQARG